MINTGRSLIILTLDAAETRSGKVGGLRFMEEGWDLYRGGQVDIRARRGRFLTLGARA
jgi:hypothetical protein